MTFSQVLYIYGIIIVEFLFEYSVFAVLFLYKLNRRNKFALRAALGFAAIFALGLPVACFYTVFGNTVWGRIFVYTFLFFGVYSAILSLFRGKLFYGAYRLRYGLRRAEPCL